MLGSGDGWPPAMGQQMFCDPRINPKCIRVRSPVGTTAIKQYFTQAVRAFFKPDFSKAFPVFRRYATIERGIDHRKQSIGDCVMVSIFDGTFESGHDAAILIQLPRLLNPGFERDLPRFDERRAGLAPSPGGEPARSTWILVSFLFCVTRPSPNSDRLCN